VVDVVGVVDVDAGVVEVVVELGVVLLVVVLEVDGAAELPILRIRLLPRSAT
jgi:hypothetical protein